MKRSIALGLVAVLVLVPAAQADAPTSDDSTLEFGLTDDDAGIDGAFEMVAETAGSGQGVPTAIDDAIWVASEPAQVDLEVVEQTVDVHLVFSELSLVQSVTAEVGLWEDGQFVSKGETTRQSQNLNVGSQVTFRVDVSSHTIEATERPALRVSSSLATLDGQAVVNPGEETAVHYSGTQPSENYPTPELGSVLLSGLGILGVLGTARMRRED